MLCLGKLYQDLVRHHLGRRFSETAIKPVGSIVVRLGGIPLTAQMFSLPHRRTSPSNALNRSVPQQSRAGFSRPSDQLKYGITGFFTAGIKCRLRRDNESAVLSRPFRELSDPRTRSRISTGRRATFRAFSSGLISALLRLCILARHGSGRVASPFGTLQRR